MNDPKLRIAAMGDIMLDRDVGEHFLNTPEDFNFNEIRETLSSYDVVIANLENPVGLRGNPHPKQDPHVAFRSHPDALQILKNLGIQVVTLANNHLLDYGEETLLDTCRHLDDAGISHLGAGNNYHNANRPLLLEINNIKIAILASVMIYSASTKRATKTSPGVADYHITPLLKKIGNLRQQGYVVIVTVHWGKEYCFYPIPYQRKQALRMIDAGSTLILGHGPHFPQGIERYNNGEIVHSLGNFIFDEPYLYAKKSFIYGAEISSETGKLETHDIYPVILKNHVPVLDEKGETSRTAVIVSNLGKIYSRKDKRFWKKINNLYFSDIVWRVFSMKSWKFVFLPPLSFYFDLGFRNILRKFNLKNFKWAMSYGVSKFHNKITGGRRSES